MTQRDVVLRWIEQVSRVIARLLYGPGPVDLVEAREAIEDALAQHLGPLNALLPRLDVESAVALIRDPDRLYGLARLLALRAALEQAEGNAAAALATRRRVRGLAEAAIAAQPEAPEEWHAWLTALREEDAAMDRGDGPA